jgi:hypothetical protein
LAETRVLWELAQRETTSPGDLATALEIDPGYLRILRRFEDQRLVTRDTVADRRRIVLRTDRRRTRRILPLSVHRVAASWDFFFHGFWDCRSATSLPESDLAVACIWLSTCSLLQVSRSATHSDRARRSPLFTRAAFTRISTGQALPKSSRYSCRFAAMIVVEVVLAASYVAWFGWQPGSLAALLVRG